MTVQHNEQPSERHILASGERLSSQLLGGVAEAARRLLAIDNFDEAMNGALEAIALAANIDRLFVYRHRVAACVYEWTAAGLGDGLAAGPDTMNEVIDRYDLAASEAAATQALVVVPIFVAGERWGNLGFENDENGRAWRETEVATLKTAADCIGSAIAREHARKTRDGLLKCVNAAAQCLVANDNLALALPATLQILGEGTRQSRAYILRNSHDDDTDELIFNLHAEWDAPRIPKKMNSGAKFPVPVSAFPARLSAPLKAGQPTQFLARELDGIAPEDRLAGQGRSLLGVPINVAGEWWGLLGLDDCLVERVWTDTEIAVLETAATVMGNAIERDRTSRARAATEKALTAIRSRVEQAAELAGVVTVALRVVGEKLTCDRLRIMHYLPPKERPKESFQPESNTGELGHFHLLYEWSVEQATSQVAIADGLMVQASDLADLTTRLIAGESVGGPVEGQMAAWPSPLLRSEMPSKAQCFYAVPIFSQRAAGKKFWGVVFIDYCRDGSRLTAAEITVFEMVASCVGGVIAASL